MSTVISILGTVLLVIGLGAYAVAFLVALFVGIAAMEVF